MSQMLQFQDEVMTKARDIFKKDRRLYIWHLFLRKTYRVLPGSYVVVKYRFREASSRTHTFWRGPLKVISNENQNIYYTI
jgi:hypothetical protein